MRNKGKKFTFLWLAIVAIAILVGIYFTFTYLLSSKAVTDSNNSILAIKVNDNDNFVYVIYLQPQQRLADIYKLSPYYYVLKTHRYLLEDGDPYIAVKKLKDYGIMQKSSPLFIMSVDRSILTKYFGNEDDDMLIIKLLNYFQRNSDIPVFSYFSFKSFYDSLMDSAPVKIDQKLQPGLSTLYNFLKLSSSVHIAYKHLPTLMQAPVEIGEFVKDGNLNHMKLQKKWYLDLDK